MGVSNKSGERKRRSLIKAVSWRLIAFVVLSIVSYIFTGDWKETTFIAVVYNVVQIGVYFLHERMWDNISWGKKKGLGQLPPAEELDPAEVEIIQNHLRDLGYIE